MVQALHEDDYDRRVEFCELLQAVLAIEPGVVDKIIWSDEAQFKLNGMINRWNGVFWSDTNNHHTIEQELNAPGLMVWLGFSSRGLVGPHFFEGKRVLFKFCVRIILCSGNVNQHTYLQMLNELVWPYCQPLGTDDLGDLRQRIIDACDMFDLNMCQGICRSVPDRLVDCINQNGHQFEHVMN